jgi:LPS export ABC transporter permease LptF
MIILSRYIIKEMTAKLVVTMASIALILVVSQITRISKIITAFGLSIENFFVPFVLMIFPYLSLLIPIAFLFSIVLVFSRMSLENEIVTMLSCGHSLSKVIKPVLLIAVLLYAFSMVCSLFLESWGRKELKKFIYDRAQLKLDYMVKNRIKPGVFADDFLGYVFYAESIQESDKEYHRVLLSPNKKIKTNKDDFVLVANSAKIIGSVKEKDLAMIFNEGKSYTLDPVKNNRSMLAFSQAKIDLYSLFQDQFMNESDLTWSAKYFNIVELKDYISELKEQPLQNERRIFSAAYLYHSKIASSFIIFTFALLGIIFGLHNPRQSRNWGFVCCLGAVLLSYVVIGLARWAAEEGYIYAPIAVWSAQLIMFLFAVALFFRKNKQPLWQ